MVKGKVPHGYKRTEVGVIPEDWEMKTLIDIGHFSKGKGIKKDEALSGNIPCVRYGEIYTKHDNIIKKYYSYITKEIAKNSVRINKGDILFAGSGETKEEIGKSVAFIDNITTYAGGDIIIFSPKNQNSEFLGYLLNCSFIRYQKSDKGQGDAVVHINSTELSKINIPLPPIPEQKAIAEVLSDTDALIFALDKLIEKKKLIKKGVMQELLTPKKNWYSKTISEFARISTGLKNTQDNVNGGLYPFFVRSPEIKRINTYTFEGEAVLVAGDGVGTGKVMHYFVGKFDYHQRVYKISDFSKEIDGFYFFLYFKKKFYNRIMQMTAKSSVDSIRLEMISEMTIKYPEIQEQQFIAKIITDIDNEIDKLEIERDKYNQIKQGMLQKLLTGQIRLVKTQPRINRVGIKHSKAFNEAVLISVIAKYYSKRDRYVIGRVKYTKIAYLFHRYTDSEIEGYKKFAAGPYDYKVRYQSEEIAMHNGYIEKSEINGYNGFIAGENVEEAEKYLIKWYGEEAHTWLSKSFNGLKRDELELIATVDRSILDLIERNIEISSDSIYNYIGSIKKWQEKLEKESFTKERIEGAIRNCYKLFCY